jgi:hypothetical protein
MMKKSSHYKSPAHYQGTTTGMNKEVTVAKGKKETREKRHELRQKAGSSNEGKYKDVPASDFAGKAGGASPHSYPINTKKRAKAALAYAHNAPNPEGIRKAVHRKYKDL